MDVEKIKSLVEQIAKAQASYGCGFYSEQSWVKPYGELLAMFGFGDDWRETEGERLHTQYWNDFHRNRKTIGERLQEERQRKRA
jgi:hypothetical protein